MGAVVAVGMATMGTSASGGPATCPGFPDTRAGQIARGACVARKLLPTHRGSTAAARENIRKACEAEIPCFIGVCHVARNVCKGALDDMCNHGGIESPADGPAFRNASCRAPRASCSTAPNAEERAICLEVLPTLGGLLKPAATAPAPVVICTSNPRMCDDGLFCNGVEGCMPGGPGADARGCIPSGQPACAKNQTCNETTDTCAWTCPDEDGDGHRAASCGGDDCDDRDPNRFPGNPEVCDARGHDEDCNPCTIASSTVRDGDRDGDGFVSRGCQNPFTGAAPACDTSRMFVDPVAKKVMGVDCDDSKVAVVPGAMVCAQNGVQICPGSDIEGTRNDAGWVVKACPRGSRCIVQPNATGVCR